MTGFDLRLQRVVNTTPEAAFRHWVDAEARRRWYAPDAAWIVEAETDLRVGGEWRVRFGPTRDWMFVEYGEFEEIDPPHRVVYTNRYEYPDGRPEFATRHRVVRGARRRHAPDPPRRRLSECGAARRQREWVARVP